MKFKSYVEKLLNKDELFLSYFIRRMNNEKKFLGEVVDNILDEIEQKIKNNEIIEGIDPEEFKNKDRATQRLEMATELGEIFEKEVPNDLKESPLDKSSMMIGILFGVNMFNLEERVIDWREEEKRRKLEEERKRIQEEEKKVQEELKQSKIQEEKVKINQLQQGYKDLDHDKLGQEFDKLYHIPQKRFIQDGALGYQYTLQDLDQYRNELLTNEKYSAVEKNKIAELSQINLLERAVMEGKIELEAAKNFLVYEKKKVGDSLTKENVLQGLTMYKEAKDRYYSRNAINRFFGYIFGYTKQERDNIEKMKEFFKNNGINEKKLDELAKNDETIALATDSLRKSEVLSKNADRVEMYKKIAEKARKKDEEWYEKEEKERIKNAQKMRKDFSKLSTKEQDIILKENASFLYNNLYGTRLKEYNATLEYVNDNFEKMEERAQIFNENAEQYQKEIDEYKDLENKLTNMKEKHLQEKTKFLTDNKLDKTTIDQERYKNDEQYKKEIDDLKNQFNNLRRTHSQEEEQFKTDNKLDEKREQVSRYKNEEKDIMEFRQKIEFIQEEENKVPDPEQFIKKEMDRMRKDMLDNPNSLTNIEKARLQKMMQHDEDYLPDIIEAMNSKDFSKRKDGINLFNATLEVDVGFEPIYDVDFAPEVERDANTEKVMENLNLDVTSKK